MTIRTRILALTNLSVVPIGWCYFLSAATILIIYLANLSVVTPVRAASNNVVIGSDADFLTCGCVSGGSGTQADPYLISGGLTRSNETLSPEASSPRLTT